MVRAVSLILASALLLGVVWSRALQADPPGPTAESRTEAASLRVVEIADRIAVAIGKDSFDTSQALRAWANAEWLVRHEVIPDPEIAGPFPELSPEARAVLPGFQPRTWWSLVELNPARRAARSFLRNPKNNPANVEAMRARDRYITRLQNAIVARLHRLVTSRARLGQRSVPQADSAQRLRELILAGRAHTREGGLLHAVQPAELKAFQDAFRALRELEGHTAIAKSPLGFRDHLDALDLGRLPAGDWSVTLRSIKAQEGHMPGPGQALPHYIDDRYVVAVVPTATMVEWERIWQEETQGWCVFTHHQAKLRRRSVQVLKAARGISQEAAAWLGGQLRAHLASMGLRFLTVGVYAGPTHGDEVTYRRPEGVTYPACRR